MESQREAPAGARAGARRTRLLALAMALAALVGTLPAAAQVKGLYYKEIAKDGRIYVFNTPERLKLWQASGDMGPSITLIGAGPAGETVIAENETALDLFAFKHDLDPYERPTPPPPPPPAPPKVLTVADGELKFGVLLQGWYVADDSPAGSSTSALGNKIGANTFRLRRAEIKLAGKITKAWGFEVMIDPAKTQSFTASGVSVTDDKILQDLAITYAGIAGHEISLGQKKLPITEESGRSSSETDFVERARVTRLFSDRREAGLFYRGALGPKVAAYASLTNGTASNVVDNSNDTLFGAVRLDVMPRTGMVVGVSGGTSGGETAAHLARDVYGAHLRYDGPDDLPIGVRAEYVAATDGQAGKADLDRDGYYATVLYTIARTYQLGVRYDEIDRNKDADGDKIKTLTVGFHWLIRGKNVNLKVDYFDVEEQGRTIGGALAEKYRQVVLGAQVAF